MSRMVSSFLVSLLLASTSAYAEDISLEHFKELRGTWKGDLDGMAKRGVIRVLTAHNPMLYFLDGPIQRGVTYEAMKQFEEDINKLFNTTWKNQISVLIIAVPRDQLLPALLAGRGDIAAANLTVTPDRQKLVEFGDPFFSGVSELIVTGSAAPNMNSLLDLSGKEVHVRESSSYFNSLQRVNVELKQSGKTPMQIVAANEQLEDYDLLEMVNACLLPAVVVDSHKAEFWKDVFTNIKVQRNFAVNTGGQIAWAFRKNSPQLKQLINKFVKTHKRGTLKGNMLLKRYLRDNKWAKSALTGSEQDKLYAVIDVFQEYANQYGLDWLLLAAQGYQESGLDQKKRSPAGAIGVMQLLPSTAADKNVNISNIEKLENNVNAGAKYLGFIRDRYFSDPSINTLNQTLLSFAAYNAGPARVARLRNEAKQLGLDPNKWFQNVEVVAAMRIGRETVQYVRNIFKYYIAYSAIFDDRVRKNAAKQETSKLIKKLTSRFLLWFSSLDSACGAN